MRYNEIWIAPENDIVSRETDSMKRIFKSLFLRSIFWAWRLCCTVITFFASAAEIPRAEKEGYLTGVYNFRTRKIDDGMDPYGWYEEDL